MNFFMRTLLLYASWQFFCLEAKQYFKDDSPAKMVMISSDYLKAKQLFLRLEALSSRIAKATTFAESRSALNRSAFYPFDQTRSCREIEGFYISASDIKTPMQDYIIAQAPIESTVANFWRMIIYKNCSLIVTACMPLESNHDRCTPYWEKPFLPKKGSRMESFLP